MKGKALLLVVLLGFPLLAEEVLTNQDVIRMVAAGLGEAVVVAKVREAPQVQFLLAVDDLLALRKAGVSEPVVQAMLDRAKPQSAPQGPAPAMPEGLGMDLVTVSLKTEGGRAPLHLVRGDMSSAGFGPYRNSFMNYPGLHSKIRTRDRRPALLVKSETALAGGHYFFAKLDSDTGNGVRSLKVSSFKAGIRAMFGSDRGAMAPDSDWVVPFEAVEESPGLWRVVLKHDLEPGEYGWYVDMTAGLQGAGLFDFGID
ncbi:MAG TPA: hypothetical protein VOA87_13635 [Thermoanaerobaculia bacterium]|nr:hypothetical protein [Thermoanaerobaculia bacterium]